MIQRWPKWSCEDRTVDVARPMSQEDPAPEHHDTHLQSLCNGKHLSLTQAVSNVNVKHKVLSEGDSELGFLSKHQLTLQDHGYGASALHVQLVTCHSGNAFHPINKVTLHQAGLVLGQVTACWQVNHLGM